MIKDYCDDNNLNMNTKAISEILYKYTSGYPFLVSRLCQIINEDMHVLVWDEQVILKAIKILLNEKNTLFDDLIKNVENNTELQDYIYDLIINGTEKSFVIDNKIIDMCYMFGYFKEVDGKVKIANNIFKQRLYNYFSSKIEENIDMSYYNFKDNFVTSTGLDFEKVLLKFQQFFKEQYSTLDSKFIEREGRLLFLAFIKPIINGTGFDFKEVQISEEKRLDVIVTYLKEKYLVELKIWRGEEYHKKGLKQLVEYLDNQDLDVGYLLIYNFNKGKEYKSEKLMIDNKEIFIVWV
ncbi:GxxExxY protein [uncultured Clostridium sp.]|uniref:GxxExxY protein n=1 Tax=uncultured Clostridium sp. TaxID=59620 RepID=UPI0025F69F42|nr:GxxExxY protein [uncultured Clostridium sp.]